VNVIIAIEYDMSLRQQQSGLPETDIEEKLSSDDEGIQNSYRSYNKDQSLFKEDKSLGILLSLFVYLQKSKLLLIEGERTGCSISSYPSKKITQEIYINTYTIPASKEQDVDKVKTFNSTSLGGDCKVIEGLCIK